MEWMVKLSSKNAEEVAMKTAGVLSPYKNHLLTITANNGKEFALHRRISRLVKINFYFAHPYKSSQRGCNENANRLIRQYFPKGTDFSTIDENEVLYVQNQLNNRPRKKLGFMTPIEYFSLFRRNKKVAFVT
jgi:IS30 family transposase